jgi:hypothetical protein
VGLKPRKKTGSGDLATRPTAIRASSFVAGLTDDRRRREAGQLLELMSDVTGERPVMWGSSIVGFGSYHYRYASGREGDWMRVGFSPRKRALTVYCMPGFADQQDLLARLGPHETSVSCLYLRRLDDVDFDVLRAIVARAYAGTADRANH